MQIFRSDSGNLHREGLPAVETANLRQYWWLNKLHNSRGPAVEELSDGKVVGRQHYWRGIYVPTPLWNQMPKMSAKEILSLPNVEMRRVAVEKVGLEKLMSEAKLVDEAPPSLVHGSKTAKLPEGDKLYRISPKDENVIFLWLVNHTPEKDGTFKRYAVRVPPETKTVAEGRNWIAGEPSGNDLVYIVES